MRSVVPLPGASKSFFFSLCFLFLIGPVFSQSLIKGKITGKEGMALAGATIRVKTTNIFAITDSAGRFTIQASPGNVIEFSFVGYREYFTYRNNSEFE